MLAVCAALGAASVGCAFTLAPRGHSCCMPAFPFQDGWLGADSAYSVPLALPFAFTGVDLARVANPLDEVEGWRIERLRLSRSGLALPASAMVVHGAHVYLFTFLDHGAGFGSPTTWASTDRSRSG